MEFAFWQALVAGFAGALTMMVLMRASTAMGMTNLPPMPLIQGAMFTDDPDKAERIGMFTHVIMMGSTHPRMQPAAAFSGDTAWRHDGPQLEIEEPGIFGVNYGGQTAMGVVLAHAAYGLVLGAVYNALIG